MDNPKVINLSTERMEKLKKQYSYSTLKVLDSSFLQGFYDKIISFFPDNRKDKVRLNLGAIQEIIVGNRIENGQSAILCGNDILHFDEELFQSKSLSTTIVYALLNAATRSKDANSISCIGIEDNKRVRKHVALNKGITQYIAESITGKPLDESIPVSSFNKDVISMISNVFGNDLIKDIYFKKGSSLIQNIFETASQDQNYFQEFSKKLDTICKLETTLRKVKTGKLKIKDQDSLLRMESVIKKEQEELIEGMLFKVVIPSLRQMDVETREVLFQNITDKYGNYLSGIAKYLPIISSSLLAEESIYKEKMTAIFDELKKDKSTFVPVLDQLQRVNLDKEVGSRIARDVISSVNSYRKQQELQSTAPEMTPFLRKELIECVKTLEILESCGTTKEVLEGVETYKNFLKKHFHTITNLDEEIARIRQGKINDQVPVETPEIPDSVREELDKARRAGEESAKRKVHGEEPKQEQVENPKYTLSDNFIIDKETGEVLSQRNLSIYDKAKNIARATGETVSLEEEIFAQMKNDSLKNYVKNLPHEPTKAMQKVYGDKWQEALISAFEAGWNSGMQQELERAKQEGIASRTKEEQPRMIDFEELKFVSENFELKTNDSGETEVINKNTNQVVTSPRTISSVLFANEWKEASATIDSNRNKQAFTPTHAELYNFFQSQTRKDIIESGNVNISELEINADLLGPNHKKVMEILFSDPKKATIVDHFFRIQTPNAKERTIIPTIEQQATNSKEGTSK